MEFAAKTTAGGPAPSHNVTKATRTLVYRICRKSARRRSIEKLRMDRLRKRDGADRLMVAVPKRSSDAVDCDIPAALTAGEPTSDAHEILDYESNP